MANENLLNELTILLRLTRTEAQIARIRVGQARTADVAQELEDNAREADERANRIEEHVRRLGGAPDVLAGAVAWLTALTKAATEQAQPFSEGLLGDLALEHQLYDRAVFTRILAEAQQETRVVDLMRRLEADHSETIEWIRIRLAELAQGGPTSLAPTAAQAAVGTMARLATVGPRQGADLVNKVAERVRRGRASAEEAVTTTRERAQQTTQAASEVLASSRDAALARAEEVAPFESVRDAAAETRRNLGTVDEKDLPIADYDAMTSEAALQAIQGLDKADDVRLVLAYEQAHKDRRGVTAGAERRLSELAEASVTS